MATGTIILPVQGFKLPTTNPARIDAGETNWRLLFDDTTAQNAVQQFRMPSNYGSSPVLKIQYSMASGVTGTIAFNVSVMAVTPGDAADINTESYDTANSGSETVAGTAGYLKELSIALANADSLAAGDFAKIKLERNATGDTSAGDAEVVAVSLEYTQA